MATLYVENVPDDLYDALRERARSNRKSITAEVLSLLRENVPTRDDLVRREKVLQFAIRAQSRRSFRSVRGGRFRSTEDVLRQDRDR